MKSWIQTHGRAVGGLCGIGSAVAFWFELKPLAIALAGVAIAFAVLAERAKSNA